MSHDNEGSTRNAFGFVSAPSLDGAVETHCAVVRAATVAQSYGQLDAWVVLDAILTAYDRGCLHELAMHVGRDFRWPSEAEAANPNDRPVSA